MTVEIILDFASGVGLLGLVASFAVAYWKYIRTQSDRQEAMKRAIFTEMLSTEYLDQAYVAVVADESKDHHIDLEVNQNSGIPVNQFLSTEIGAAYYDDFGLLDGDEIEAVTAYYSEAQNLCDIIRTRRIFEMSVKQEHDHLVDEMNDIVAGEIKAVKKRRDRLLRMWCADFDYTPEDLEDHGIYLRPADTSESD